MSRLKLKFCDKMKAGFLGRLAQLVRASGLHPAGRGFDSLIAHHYFFEINMNDSELQSVKNKLREAYNLLLKNDGYLLEKDVNERSLTHKYAEYLKELFPGYNVDCEYNRDGLDPKKLIGLKEKISSDDTNGRTVYPDIIIHHRGTKNNLVVIEAKKSKNKGNDIKKLLEYKNQLGYDYAFAVKFLVEEEFKKYGSEEIDWEKLIKLK